MAHTADFILIASTLVLIKSKSLLPTLSLSEEEQAWWQKRVHYVNQTAALLGGWLGPNMTNPGWGGAAGNFGTGGGTSWGI